MKISKLQKKIGQFTLQIEELYLESGKVHGLIEPMAAEKQRFPS